MSVAFELDGRAVHVPEGGSLLDALRERLGCRTPKDGCSPQGQCGCCTVWVDGAPRVSCVTPVGRVAGRSVTTTEGLDEEVRRRWGDAFVATGASQCGFCTPGIVMRLAALESRSRPVDRVAVRTALLAHLCRCTGWLSVVEAAELALSGAAGPPEPRDPLLVAWRAQLEGRVAQVTGPETVLGAAGFADDSAPGDSLVAVVGTAGTLVVAEELGQARRAAARVPGRNSTVALAHPVDLPEGDWALTLRTTWVEPAYLEPDASWALPGGCAASPLANGGAFGAKGRSSVVEDAARLAGDLGRPVRVIWSREDVVRRGPKRPPVAVGVRPDGTGVMRVGLAGDPDRAKAALGVVVERVAQVAPGLEVQGVPVAGPPVSADLRGAGWVEASVVVVAQRALAEGRTGPGTAVEVTGPEGGRAKVAVAADGGVSVEVWAGEVLDPVTLRSYCLGAVHQALGWVYSEGIAVDETGEVQDLTIRSFGVLAARDTPSVDVTLHPEDRWPVNGSDAVFAATAAAAWLAEGLAPTWPSRRGRPGGVRS